MRRAERRTVAGHVRPDTRSPASGGRTEAATATQARAMGVATGYSARDHACRSPAPDHPGDQQVIGAVVTPFSGPGGTSSTSSGGRGIDVISVTCRSPTATPPSALRRPRLGTAHGRLATPRVTSPRSGWSGGTNGQNSARRAKGTNRQSRTEWGPVHTSGTTDRPARSGRPHGAWDHLPQRITYETFWTLANKIAIT